MIGLGSILWASPWMLLGVAAVAAPLIAHWLQRRWRRQLAFPMVALMSQAMADRSSLYRMRRRILLGLRCGVVVLIAAAFARPSWWGGSVASAGVSKGRVCVLLVDVSGSMKHRIDDLTQGQRAVAQAQKWLDDLDPNQDRANIIYVAAKPLDLHGKPIPQPHALRGELQAVFDRAAASGLTPSDQQADWSAAVRLAVSQIGETTSAAHLVVISDFISDRDLNWASLVPDHIDLQRIDLGASAVPANVSVDQMRLYPSTPQVGRAAQLMAMVTNHGTESHPVRVRGWVEKQWVGDQSMALQPGESRPVVFEHRFERGGPQRVRIALDRSDGLAEDDEVRSVVSPVQSQEVVLISQQNPKDPSAGAYYLQRALSPSDAAPIRVRWLRPDQVNRETSLEGVSMVVVAKTGLWTSIMADRLIDHATSGGSVVWFWSDGQAPANAARWNRHTQTTEALPLPVGAIDAAGSTMGLKVVDPSQKPFHLFGSSAHRAFEQVQCRERHVLPLGEEPRDLLHFEDGRPAMTVRRQGKGRLVLAAFGLAPNQCDLHQHAELFVPMVHGLLDAWQPAGRSLSVLPGERVALTVISEKPNLQVMGPNGPVAHQIEQFGHRLVLSFEAPRESGFVEIQDAGKPIEHVAVNFDPRESTWRRSSQPVDRSTHGQKFSEAPPSEGGQPMWPGLVIAALGVLGLEMLLLSVWSR